MRLRNFLDNRSFNWSCDWCLLLLAVLALLNPRQELGLPVVPALFHYSQGLFRLNSALRLVHLGLFLSLAHLSLVLFLPVHFLIAHSWEPVFTVL